MQCRSIIGEDLAVMANWVGDVDALARFMTTPAFHGLMAYQDKQQLGIIYGWHYDHDVEVIDIMVHPDHRRKGVGTQLMRAFIHDVQANSCKLEVRADNKPALAFYSKFGLIKDGVRSDYYRDEAGYCDAVLMTYRPVLEEEN